MNDAVKQMLARYDTSDVSSRERALREIIQEIALVGLWRSKFFTKAAFYGGTALRILYGLDRFSEDLDFTLLRPDSHFSWANYRQPLIDELAAYEPISINHFGRFLASRLDFSLNFSPNFHNFFHHWISQIQLSD